MYHDGHTDQQPGQLSKEWTKKSEAEGKQKDHGCDYRPLDVVPYQGWIKRLVYQSMIAACIPPEQHDEHAGDR